MTDEATPMRPDLAGATAIITGGGGGIGARDPGPRAGQRRRSEPLTATKTCATTRTGP
jgi:hypothetical protein